MPPIAFKTTGFWIANCPCAFRAGYSPAWIKSGTIGEVRPIASARL
jgi:hypothetical protein